MMAFFFTLFLANVMITTEGPSTSTVPTPPSQQAVVETTSEGIGKVLELIGEANAVSSENSKKRSLAENDSVYVNETITTGADSSVQLELNDGSLFTISADTTIRIDALTFNESSGTGNLAASITKGIFRFVTGKIAVKNPENVNIEVPSGTIGIRGTIIEGEVEGEKCLVSLGEETGGETGKHRIIVSSKVEGKIQQVEITKPGFATMIPARGQMPRPAFQLPQAERNRFQQKLPQPQFHQRGAEGRWQRDPNAPPPRNRAQQSEERRQNQGGGSPPGGQGPNGPGGENLNVGNLGPGGQNPNPNRNGSMENTKPIMARENFNQRPGRPLQGQPQASPNRVGPPQQSSPQPAKAPNGERPRKRQ